MDLSDDTDAKTRTINKFYSRIRSHLDDLEVSEPERVKPIAERLKNLKEDEKYGVITPKEFDIFLKAYEKDPNKPATSSQLEATSLSKLLFSKPGFHEASSTAYLVEDLRINDRTRNSFLGGHSTYVTKKENTTEHITKCQQKMFIAKRSKDILDEMERTALEEVREVDITELVRLDHNNGDTLACRGRYSFLRRSFDTAVEEFKRALEHNTCHVVLVRRYLAIALFEMGLKMYMGRRYPDAFRHFEEALTYDPQHQSAHKHLQLCNEQMINQQVRPFGYHDQRVNFNQRRR